MKNQLRFFAFLLGVVCLQISCKPVDDSNDPNVINDTKGVKVELTWSNSSTQPTLNTDLDLSIEDQTSGKSLLSSNSYINFESINVNSNALNNGSYNLAVTVREIDRSTNYTITCTGIGEGKSYSKTYGPIKINDVYTTLKPMSLTVSGNKYVLN